MRRFTLLFIILCTGTVIAASFTSTRFPNNFFVMHDEYALPLPDSTYEDSTNIYQPYDTSYAYSDGGDSIYFLADSILNDSTTTDTTYIEGRIGNFGLPILSITRNPNANATAKVGAGTGPIVCDPLWDGSAPENTNKGLYGINVSGMFDNATCPNDGSAADQWQWLSDLRPEVLRFPHGANGKFMHLLHTVGGAATDTAVGYGYDLAELIRYFDASDNNVTNLVPTLYATTAAAIAAIAIQTDADLPTWNTWMDASVSGQFGDFLKKWRTQQELVVTATDHRNYLTDFIKLIRQIETNNPGHTVKIIVDLNIISESSSECAAIVNFLRSNPIHNCTVVGVELGNECPSDFHWTVMGFAHFSEHDAGACDKAFNGSYWSFINGDPYAETLAQTRLNTFLNPAMQLQDATGHYYNRDFIKAFKYNFTTNCKIGIPGEGTPGDNLTPQPVFLLSCPRTATEWNTDIVFHYADEIATMPPGLSKKKFDAVILHIYLDDKQNWGGIVDDAIPPVVTPFTDGLWNFASYDSRLQSAFNGILFFDPANPTLTASDSFMGFIKYGHKVAWDDYKTVFNFTTPTLADNVRKELWMTEYNIKTSVDIGLRRGVYTNGFTHGFVLQEWFLKNLKVNYASGYKKNFFTYATYQNYAGVGEDLLTPADRPRELYNYLCKNYSPYNLGGLNPNQRDYYMRRTSYFVMSMLREISAQNLKYVKTRYISGVSNLNPMPTMFIDPGNNYLYMYYSNVKSTEQDYEINGEYLAGLFSPTPIISFGTATLRYVKGTQLYSCSGSSTLFDPLFNTGYTNPTPTDRTCYDPEVTPAYLYQIEIQNTTFSVNSPDCASTPSTIGGCITVPPYSVGYVKIPIFKNYKIEAPKVSEESETILYPNPANTKFSFYTTLNENQTSPAKVEVYSLTGNLILTQKVMENAVIDISDIPSGIYLVKIFENDILLSVQRLIKAN
ncbi:MAG: T9SS type A sorting domain-containing protein [Chitinophagales bacterium]|nr:T9SS type A sorting domain-containing protein [Bacteroidota bacterium]MBK9554605.1 T9SS type A sorting domain-containing protein [Bacteroidota bacterium]MBP8248510.1 T9SS type A sorting domain-containing protein [Chitinophagales bacterium]MBP9879204.1 T9SS type A sorting domain-containing protein [Chitinophagales bacterium]